MSERRILLVEPDGQQADLVVSRLKTMNRTALVVPSCAEAAEALVLQQRFEAVLLGSGQIPEEVRELTDYIGSLETEAPVVLTYASGMPETTVRLLPPDFTPAQLQEALERKSPSHSPQSADPPVFLQTEFTEQCAGEKSLMVEIIDLFEGEREEQFAAMTDALASGDFERLSKLAHSLKGSVSALHAPAARQSCQAIELAAKNQDPDLCAAHLNRLRQNLADLAEPLRRFKEACLEA
jgi:HPt (histidine-containing phosphotransfer) domain-containing protein